jgi:hypothetical protein
MIIDCHVHAGELNKHYPIWWIEELGCINGPTMDLRSSNDVCRRTARIPDGSTARRRQRVELA